MKIILRNDAPGIIFQRVKRLLNNSLGFLALLLILTLPAFAGAGKADHNHKKNKSHSALRKFDGGPTLSYGSPQTLTAGQAVTLTPNSSNISPYGYDLYGNTNVTPLSLSQQVQPQGIVADAAGNIYVAQLTEVDKVLAGSLTVQQIATGFSGLSNIAIDATGNLYVTDYTANQVIKIPAGTSNKVVIGTGIVGPAGVAVDPAGNVYVAEYNSGNVKKILAGTNTTTVIGTGFNNPFGLALDALGNLYVADSGNDVIKEINVDGAVTTLDFQELGAGTSLPSEITIDAAGTLFVEIYNAFGQNNLIIYKHLTEASQSEGAFDNMPNLINGIATDGLGNVYAATADSYLNNVGVMRYAPEGGYFINRPLPSGLTFNSETGVISGTPLAASPSADYIVTAYHVDTLGNQSAVTATMNITVNAPAAPVISYASPQVYPINATITPVSPANTGGPVGNFVYYPTATKVGTGFSLPNGVAKDALGNIYVADRGNNAVKEISGRGTTTLGSGFSKPTGVAVDAAGNVYVADNGNNAIKKIPAGIGTPVTWGSGFNKPLGIAIDAAGNVYVADRGNNAIKKISASGSTTTTLASGLNAPSGVAVDAAGNVYVAETGTGSIDRIPAGGGSPQLVTFGLGNPFGVAVDAGGIVYAIGQSDYTLYRINTHGSAAPEVLGSEFNSPEGIMVDNAGNIYIADTGSNTVKEVQPVGGYFLKPALPAGMLFDDFTGIISGTPSLLSPASTYMVTARNPTGSSTKTFSLQVTANANLSNLTTSGGPLSPAFDINTTAYTTNVSNATTSVTVTPTVFAAGATVTVNGSAVASGSASAALPLNVGANAINIVVTGTDGTTTKTYTLTVNRTGASNANLAGLTISTGTLKPGFATATTSYTVSVGSGISSVTITPTTSDATATVKVNGTTVASGSASPAIALAVGQNTINTVVTAQDGVTVQTYIITVTRAASTNAKLLSFTTNAGVLTPGFNNTITSYTKSVGNTITSITFTPTTVDATATVTVNGAAVTSGTASAAIVLAVGSSVINTIVTAQDGVTKITYSVTVTRAASGDATLSNLALNTGTLNPAFASATTAYTDPVPNSVTSITITPTVNDPTATVQVNGSAVASGTASGAIALSVGTNVINTIVTAQNGSAKTYKVSVTRAASSNANLAVLTISTGNLKPVFATGTLAYTVSVGNGVTSVTVTPTTSDVNARLTVNGKTVATGAASPAIALTVGSNKISTIVTAQDGVTTKTYSITVTRAPSTNAKLLSLTTSNGAVSPAFNNTITSYTRAVPNSATSITFTPTVVDATATITINGVGATSGVASAAQPLVVGSNTENIKVTAQDGVTTITYTVTVNRAAGSMNTVDGPVGVEQPIERPQLAEDNINVHQGLSPNGDGINDFLVIDGIANHPDNKLQIMNRSGQLVFEAKGYDNSTKVFDGHSSKNGQMQLPGTYFYSLNYTDQGISKHKTGFIVIKY